MIERTVEFNASTVDEAVEKARDSLGLSPEDLSYEVLDSGSSGFMGIGARDARISVRLESEPEADEMKSPSSLAEQVTARENESEPPVVVEGETPGDNVGSASASKSEGFDNVALPSSVPEDLLSEVRDYVDRAVRLMDIDARIEAYDVGEVIAVDVATEQTGLFIGQKGETIDALQYLLNVSVYRDREFLKRIVIDSEGYRQRRIEAIQGIAHRMARRALREKRPVELPPMSPSERRVVHLYLQDDDRVATSSEGNGENRRVRVSPL